MLELELVHTKSLHMLDMLARSSKERISVEVLAGLEILEGLRVQIREELEVHSKIVKSEVWRSLLHLTPPRMSVEDDHVPYGVVYSSLSTK